MLHMGWSVHFRTERYFQHPCLEPDAAERILDTGVRTLALDSPSPDPIGPNRSAPASFPVHRLVLGAGCVIAENLTNVGAVDFADPVVSLLPLALAGADGAPVRAVAMKL